MAHHYSLLGWILLHYSKSNAYRIRKCKSHNWGPWISKVCTLMMPFCSKFVSPSTVTILLLLPLFSWLYRRHNIPRLHQFPLEGRDTVLSSGWGSFTKEALLYTLRSGWSPAIKVVGSGGVEALMWSTLMIWSRLSPTLPILHIIRTTLLTIWICVFTSSCFAL